MVIVKDFGMFFLGFSGRLERFFFVKVGDAVRNSLLWLNKMLGDVISYAFLLGHLGVSDFQHNTASPAGPDSGWSPWVCHTKLKRNKFAF